MGNVWLHTLHQPNKDKKKVKDYIEIWRIYLISVGDPRHFRADSDPHFWLMDPAPKADPIPDPTSFFIDIKDAKKILLKIFFCYNLGTRKQIIFSLEI
jgi:hypothetical protein